jgi:hypothetical protein
MNQASIILSRKTLEKIEYAYSDFYDDELLQIQEALKAMRIKDELEQINEVPIPNGLIAPPKQRKG